MAFDHAFQFADDFFYICSVGCNVARVKRFFKAIYLLFTLQVWGDIILFSSRQQREKVLEAVSQLRSKIEAG
jgi:hypothetical protein